MDSSRQYSLVKETKCRDDAGVVMLMKEPRGVVHAKRSVVGNKI